MKRFLCFPLTVVFAACESAGVYEVPLDLENEPADTGSDAGDADNDEDDEFNPIVVEDEDDNNNDEGHTSVWCLDQDGDGYGDPYYAVNAESVASGYVAACTDCDDGDASVHPGASDTTTDGVDQDCDGDDNNVTGSTWYRDADSDGYGTSGTTTTATAQPSGYVGNASDCDDTNASINPGVSETTGNGLDDDCNSSTSDSSTSTATTWYRDADSDGYGTSGTTTTATAQPSGYVGNASDCDDTNASINPGVSETTGNGLDDDCNSSTSDSSTSTATTWYRDADSDGYGTSSSTTSASTQPSGYVGNASDCDDGNASVNPSASEGSAADGVDQDCDGTVDEGTSSSSSRTTWYVTVSPDSSSESWRLSIANTSSSDWSQWFTSSSKATGDQSASFSGMVADVVYLNGVYGSGWLAENTSSSTCQVHVSSVKFGTSSPASNTYSVTTATSGSDCVCKSNGSGGWNLECTLK